MKVICEVFKGNAVINNRGTNNLAPNWRRTQPNYIKPTTHCAIVGRPRQKMTKGGDIFGRGSRLVGVLVLGLGQTFDSVGKIG